jgi:hypothetical protein
MASNPRILGPTIALQWPLSAPLRSPLTLTTLDTGLVKGLVYVAGSFETVSRSKCGRGGAWIDNDPHSRTNPLMWAVS